MLNFKWVAFLAVFLISAHPIYAQILSLASALETVEKNYPELKMYDARINALLAKSEGSKSWMAPTISLGLNRIPYNISQINDPMMQTVSGAMLSIEQMIPNPSKLNAREKYLQSLSNASITEKEWTKNQLLWEARKLYYQRFIAERNLTLLNEGEELLRLLINSAESKYAYNQAGLSNIFKAKAKLEDIKNTKLMQEGIIEESSIGLNTLMNLNANTQFSIDTIVERKNYQNELLLDRADSAILNRNDIATIDNNIQSMQLNKEMVLRNAKPDFGIRFEHMHMFNMDPMYSVMGMISIPIAPWASKMYKSDAKAMDFQIESMQREKEDMQLMAGRMIHEKISMLKYSNQQLHNYDEGIIPSYQKNFESSLMAFKENTGDLFIVLDSWEMLLMKQMERNQLMGYILKTEADYEKETENN